MHWFNMLRRIRAAAASGLRFLRCFRLDRTVECNRFANEGFEGGPSTDCPSWISIARRVLPSRLALKRRVGSCSDVPLAKVGFILSL